MKKTTEAALEVKYGLPAQVEFCRKCVISNQRPNSIQEFKVQAETPRQTIHFDSEGVCDACRYAEKKDKIDWNEREKELKDLLERYRSKDGSYDVLVPGSGGKDSVYAAHVLKYKYGMHPLTCTWAPHMYTDVGWRNFQNWIHVGGFDNELTTPNGRVHRLLTKFAFENLVHPFQPFILGQKNLAPKVALRRGLKLIFYGENEAEYGNPTRENMQAKRDVKYFSDENMNHDKLFLGGVSVRQLREEHGIPRAELEAYLPVGAEDMHRGGIDIRYLGYYLKWHPQSCYYYAVEHSGFAANPERTEGTYSKYNSLDDKIDGFHYYTTFIKFGIGRATYDAAQEIRSKDITREEGVALVKRFDGEFPKKYFKEFLDYIGITQERFIEIVDGARSPHLWKKEGGQWKLRHQVS